MKKQLGIAAIVFSLPLYAGTMGESAQINPWYASIGTGFSWTQLPGIKNPNPAQWDNSVQGYDSHLGNRGFYTFEVGKQVHRFIDVSVLYLDHEPFNYQKFQTGTSDTEGFTGSSRTRYFDLNNRAVLVNGFLHPDHSLYNISTVNFTPFVGGGIGYALNQLDKFYTVGTIDAGGVALGSTSSLGNKVNTNSFAWQGSVGLNIRPEASHVSVDVGYRYYDGGQFNGSSSVYSDSAGIVSATPWSGRVKANQLFVDFKYTL